MWSESYILTLTTSKVQLSPGYPPLFGSVYTYKECNKLYVIYYNYS